MKLLHGVVVPIVTPMHTSGEVNYQGLQQLCEFLASKNINGVFVNGTTGEFPLLSVSERMRVLETCIKSIKGDKLVVVQVGAQSARDTIKLAKHSVETGADGVAIVAPCYFKYDDDDLLRYFEDVIEAIPETPVYLYNIPQYTGNDISFDVAKRLVKNHKNVVGIKDSSGNMNKLITWIDLKRDFDKSFAVLVGSDYLSLVFLKAGGDGIVSGIAGVFPEVYTKFYDLYKEGRVAEAEALYTVIRKLSLAFKGGARLDYFKEVLKWRGINAGKTRSPLPNLGETESVELKSNLIGVMGEGQWRSIFGGEV